MRAHPSLSDPRTLPGVHSWPLVSRLVKLDLSYYLKHSHGWSSSTNVITIIITIISSKNLKPALLSLSYQPSLHFSLTWLMPSWNYANIDSLTGTDDSAKSKPTNKLSLSVCLSFSATFYSQLLLLLLLFIEHKQTDWLLPWLYARKETKLGDFLVLVEHWFLWHSFLKCFPLPLTFLSFPLPFSIWSGTLCLFVWLLDLSGLVQVE